MFTAIVHRAAPVLKKIPFSTCATTLVHCPSPDDAADAAAIAALLRASNADAALANSPVTPRPSLIDALIRDSSAELSAGPLLSLARWAGPSLSSSQLASFVDLLSLRRSFHSAWSLLLPHPPGPHLIPSFSSLIRRYSRAAMPHAALRTYNYALQSTADSDDLFLVLLDALCKEGHVRSASDLFTNKRSSGGWAPSAPFYNVLLHGWFRARKLRKAERLWEEMRGDGVPPTIVTYGILIEGLCRMRRPDQALSLLDEMKPAGLEPNPLHVNPIIDSLAEDGRFKEALGFLEKFPLYGISPNISTYNSLVKGFCKHGDLVGASNTLKAMIGRDVLPTATTYNYFFKHFSKSGKIEEGMNLYTKMIQSGYAPDRLTYQLLIKMLCEKQRLELAVQLIKEMNMNGFESDLATSTMLVHLLCRLRRYQEACEAFEEMIKRGVVPQYITYQRRG
ncbi:putative tetratricopeptide-like helical domain superfamily [Dioscorea sansibarensis]